MSVRAKSILLASAIALASPAALGQYIYRIPLLEGVDALPPATTPGGGTGNPGGSEPGGTGPGGTNPGGGTGNPGGGTENPPQSLAISAALPPETMSGMGLSVGVGASGGTGARTITAVTLPPGLHFDGSAITGTPDPGTHPYLFRVTDSATPPATAEASGTIVSYAPLTASVTGGSPDASVTKDRPYGPFQISSSGGKGAHAYGLYSGSLPQGVTLSATGLLSGNPTQVGAFSFRLAVSEEFSPSTPWISPEYTVNVTPVALLACVRTVTAAKSMTAAQVTAALDGAPSVEINYAIVGGGMGGDGYNSGYVYSGANGGDTTISVNGQVRDTARGGGLNSGFTAGQSKTGYVTLSANQSLAMQVGGGGAGGNSASSGGGSGANGGGGGGAGGSSGGAGGTNGANGQAGTGNASFPGGHVRWRRDAVLRHADEPGAARRRRQARHLRELLLAGDVEELPTRIGRVRRPGHLLVLAYELRHLTRPAQRARRRRPKSTRRR